MKEGREGKGREGKERKGRKEGRGGVLFCFGHFKELLLSLCVYSSREFVLTCQILCFTKLLLTSLYSLSSLSLKN